jgi:hypothetical protein
MLYYLQLVTLCEHLDSVWFYFIVLGEGRAPAAAAYGVYLSQLIRYSRAGGSYQDFFDRGLMLTRKLPN